MRQARHSVDITGEATILTDVPTQVHQARSMKLAIWFVVAIILVNVIGFTGIWTINAAKLSRNATHDLALHMATIQTLMQRPDLAEPANLVRLQDEMRAAISDLNALESIIPLGGAVGSAQIQRLHHSLLMGRDFLQATQNLIASIVIIEPHLQSLLLSILGIPLSAQEAQPLTFDEIHSAQRLLNAGLTSWASARQEMSLAGTQPIGNTFGIDSHSVNALSHLIADTSASLNIAFPAASAILDNLFIFMGVAHPSHLLVVLLDPDQLRPIGGALGGYGVVELTGGLVASKVQFHDIVDLDCPHVCTRNPIPRPYSWFTPANGIFGVRDSGLDPDLQASGMIIHNLFFQETGISVDGIMALTPTVLQHILRVLGPVEVRDLGITASASSVANQLYQAHQRGLAQASPGKLPRTSDEKFLTSIFGALDKANDSQLHQVGAALLHDVLTKDLLLYTPYDRPEAQFALFNANGIADSPSDDSMSVFDTNLGTDDTSTAIRESIADLIKLDPAGIAQHMVKITYTYPIATHPSSPAGPFDDLVEVIVPATMISAAITGPCKYVAVPSGEQTILGCRFHLTPGSTISLYFSWKVQLIGANTYRLLLRRQPGAFQNINLTFTSSVGKKLTSPTAGMRVAKGTLTWASTSLTSDVALNVSAITR